MREGELVTTQTAAVGLQPEITPDVFAFGREQGVDHYLQPLIELTQQVYPTATRFHIHVEDDPATPDRHILFELDVLLDTQQYLASDRHWHEGWLAIEQYPRSCVFRVRIIPQ